MRDESLGPALCPLSVFGVLRVKDGSLFVPVALWAAGHPDSPGSAGVWRDEGKGERAKAPRPPAVCPSDVPVRRPLVLPPFPGAWSWAGPGFPSVRAKFQVGFPSAAGRWRIVNPES